MSLPAKVAFGFVAALYPLAVFACLVVFRVPVRVFALFVVAVGAAYLVAATGGGIRRNARLLVSAALLLAGGVVCLATGRTLFIKLYPVAMNAVFLSAFAATLAFPPNVCFRMACLADRNLAGSVAAPRVERYCRAVTLVWCGFFVLNGSVAAATVLSQSDRLWSLYNGGISYALMGVLFAVEFIIRKAVDKKMPKSIPISKFRADSRADDTDLCFDGRWTDGKLLRWGDFLRDTAKIRAFVRSSPNDGSWILHAEDRWLFLCAFVALLQERREVLVTANVAPEFVAEIVSGGGAEGGRVRFLTDLYEVEGRRVGGADLLPRILADTAVTEEEIRSAPEIDADSTRIVLYTSGSTGRPKAVRQRMTEFEADNAFVIRKWGGEFLSRRLVATVSQHHIYGLLFSILLPFTLAVPFRRRRVEFPSEFQTLSDSPYMVVAVPAFLKRACAELEGARLPLDDPWIFTSGGAVSPELAEETGRTFGFCPMEVYGSTETSGIAYRQQSRDGLLWTPFDNARIWLDEGDGCLTIVSPYIKDPAGFKTGDLAEIRDDGRFLLKGRADSIVKIEEKRISLPEVEARILQSGLAADCAVVAMAGRRQYLAAAVVLNAAGLEKFRGVPKFRVNRWFHDFLLQFFENVVLPKRWRFPETIPVDAQGKKHRDDVKALFSDSAESDGSGESEASEGIPAGFAEFLARHGLSGAEVVERSAGSVKLDVVISGGSDYLDGHFPGFPLLPAVAQVDVAAHAALSFLGVPLGVSRVRRLKFTEKVLPGATVRFSVSFESSSNRVSFESSAPDGSARYSSGGWTAGGGE